MLPLAGREQGRALPDGFPREARRVREGIVYLACAHVTSNQVTPKHRLMSGFLFMAVALANETALEAGSPWAVVWAAPGILVSSLMIAWGAEATQFFISQGIALAVLALLQTLPEFAVEAVLAWHRETPYLFANLTGALMLLTGLGWPLIYFSAARAYRREHKSALQRIQLDEEQAVQVLGLFAGIAYEMVIWWKGSLNLIDGVVLVAIYVAYLWIMRRLPPEKPETMDEIEGVPKAIIRATKPVRILSIIGLFLIGGAAVFAVATPFLTGLFGLSLMLGISRFQFIQWIAPLVSEAPEGISAFYWARDYQRAPIALMNLVSSNINQWTLLAAMLPVVLSMSLKQPTAIVLDAQQSQDLLLALSQSLLGALFLMNMELAWWEAVGLFALFLVQLSWEQTHPIITAIYFGWCAVEVLRLIVGNRKASALRHFREILRTPK
jgi:cation:H+ antiporter